MKSITAFCVGLLMTASVAGANAQERTIRAVSGFSQGMFSAKFEQFVNRVNETGKGVIQINYIGGPQAVPPFEIGNAIRSRVVDLANVPGAFYTNLMPEADVSKLIPKPMSARHNTELWSYFNTIHNEKLNAWHLTRQFHNVEFHIYLNKKIDKPSLKGLKIRVVPLFKDFVEALGGSPITMPPGEIYTALERGVVDGYGWPSTGIFDLGLDRVTKFRVEPGFYASEVNILVNLTTWKSLTDQQRDVLENAAAWLETLNEQNVAEVKGEIERQQKAGIAPITFSAADAEAYTKLARDIGWQGVIRRAPVSGPKLRELAGN